MCSDIYCCILQWLENDFLEYLSEWEVYADKNAESANEKAKMILSRETLEGIRITCMLLLDLNRIDTHAHSL